MELGVRNPEGVRAMADFDVRAFDDDGADHSNDFNSTTDEGWFVPTDFSTLGATYPFYLKHYNTAESAEIGATGTGLFNPFLNMNGDSTLIGFNTNDDIKKPYTDAGLDISDPNTDAIQLGDIPIVYKDLDGNGTPEAYYVINLDINENVNSEVSLEELQLYTSSASAVLADYHGGSPLAFANNPGDPATDFTLRFDLDAGGDAQCRVAEMQALGWDEAPGLPLPDTHRDLDLAELIPDYTVSVPEASPSGRGRAKRG